MLSSLIYRFPYMKISVSPKKVISSTGPKLVPFFKAVVLYFLFDPANSLSFAFCFIKCLPILILIGFVLSNQRKTLFKFPHQQPTTSVNNRNEFDFTTISNKNNIFRIKYLFYQLFKCLKDLWDDFDFMRLTTADGHYSRFILLGLCFSCFGDAFLFFAPINDIFFKLGILFFGLAHISYFIAFGYKPFNTIAALFSLLFGVSTYSFYFSYFIDIDTKIFCGIYICLIYAMLWRAFVFGMLPMWKPSAWTGLMAVLGAVLFIVSDFSLCYDKFVSTLPHSTAIIMTTYYMAQMFIALSVTEGEEIRPKFKCCED